jgi:uncharacterized membrane protein
MTRLMVLVLALISLAVVLAPTVAAAEDDMPECHEVDGVVRCGPVVVHGNVPRPGAFYVIDRSRLSFESTLVDEDFIQDVVDSVNRTPF